MAIAVIAPTAHPNVLHITSSVSHIPVRVMSCNISIVSDVIKPINTTVFIFSYANLSRFHRVYRILCCKSSRKKSLHNHLE